MPNETTLPRETYTVGEVADILGISRSSAHRTIARDQKLGPLTPIRIGKRILFGRKAVEAVLAGEGLAEEVSE